jgi:hypothetical protein
MESLAVSHMICIGFYFLMRPGEHTTPPGDSIPFLLQDVEFMIGHHRYNGCTVPLNLLPLVTFALLIFTNQKNGMHGKKIGHGKSGHHRSCAVKALTHHLWHLRENGAPYDTPLCTYYMNGLARFVTSQDIITTFCTSIAILGPNALGF